MYLIWSNEHRAWWKPHSNGYTTDISKAGVYAVEAMERICEQATIDWTKAPNEVPVEMNSLPAGAKKLITNAEVSF